MRRVPLLLFAAAVAAVVGSAAGRYFRTDRKVPISMGQAPLALTVSEADLDFGDVWESEEREHILRVTNPGSKELEVSGWSTSCNCMEVQPRSLKIPAGETAVVRLKMKLARGPAVGTLDASAIQPSRDSSRAPSLAASLAISPIVENTAAKPLSWTLSGRIKLRWQLGASSIDFGSEPGEGRPAVYRRFLVRTFVPCTSIACRIDGSPVRASASTIPSRPGHWRIEVVAPVEAPIGPLDGRLTLLAQLPDGKSENKGSLPLAGLKQGDVVPFPAAAHFSVSEVGEPRDEFITFSSTSNQAFEAEFLSCESRCVSVERVSNLEQEGRRVFRVSMRSSEAGKVKSEIAIRIRATGRADTTIIVPVSGWVVER